MQLTFVEHDLNGWYAVKDYKGCNGEAVTLPFVEGGLHTAPDSFSGIRGHMWKRLGTLDYVCA